MARGMVVRAPTSTSVHPTAWRWAAGRRSASRRPTPAPSIPRVPAIRASSGKVTRASLMTMALSCGEWAGPSILADLDAVRPGGPPDASLDNLDLSLAVFAGVVFVV